MLELFLGRQIKYFLSNGKLTIHLLLGESKVDDVEETWRIGLASWRRGSCMALLTNVLDGVEELLC